MEALEGIEVMDGVWTRRSLNAWASRRVVVWRIEVWRLCRHVDVLLTCEHEGMEAWSRKGVDGT
jgi:hypothetical protein